MVVYVDNNVLIDFENDSSILQRKKGLCYIYSYVHLEELLESGKDFESRKNKRLSTIHKLTNNKYVEMDEDERLRIIYQSPNQTLKSQMNPLSELIRSELKESHQNSRILENPDYFIDLLGIDTRVFNNDTEKKIIDAYGDNINLYLKATAQNPLEKYQSFFSIVDLFGYWRDKNIKKALRTRLYNANHAFFASCSDYFVTNDTRTRKKANLAYYFFHHKTKSISLEAF